MRFDEIRRWLIIGVVDTASILETQGMQPEELNEGGITNISEETGCDKKDKDVSEEVKCPVYLTLKDVAKIFQNIENTKNVLSILCHR